MNVSRLTLILAVGLLAGEVGIRLWHSRPVSASHDPTFRWVWDGGVLHPPDKTSLEYKTYRFDRTANVNFDEKKGRSLRVIYMEWDRIEAGPFIEFALHPAEICNEKIGYRLIRHEETRRLDVEGASPLEFDVTRFHNPAGELVFMFRTAWIQGLGSWQLKDQSRQNRLHRTLTRHSGNGRIIHAAAFRTESVDEAWSLMRAHVLEKLVWSHQGGEGTGEGTE